MYEMRMQIESQVGEKERGRGKRRVGSKMGQLRVEMVVVFKVLKAFMK